MGAGKSRLKSNQCSNADFKNTETANTTVNAHNTKHTTNNKAKNSNDFDCVRRNLERPRSQRDCKDAYVCNNALTNYDVNSTSTRRYSLEPLTGEQQLDEIVKVFQAEKREKAGEIPTVLRRSSGPTKTRTTCCNYNCNCAKTKKLPYQVEKRNGLQNLSPLGGDACRCSRCNGRMGKLSEAEAIAIAITEYCCRERRKTYGKSSKSRRCHKCNCELQEENKWRPQDMESDDEQETDTDIELEVEMEDMCCCTQHNQGRREERRRTTCCKCAEKTKRQKQKQFEEEEMDEEMVEMEESLEEVVEEEVVDEEQHVVTSTKQRKGGGQPHAKLCRCCVCKKKKGAVELSVKGEEEISVADIELQVQEVRENTQKLSAVALQSKRQPVRSQTPELKSRPEDKLNNVPIRNLAQPHMKGCRCCDCKQESETREFIAEKEVLLEKINLKGGSRESVNKLRGNPPVKDLPNRLRPNKDIRGRSQRSRSEELHNVTPKSHYRTHVKDCRCCDFINGKPPQESWRSDGSREVSVDSMEIEIKTELEREKLTRLRRSIEDEPQSRRDHSRGIQERQDRHEIKEREGRQERQVRQERILAESSVDRDVRGRKNQAKPHEATDKVHQICRDQTKGRPHIKSERRETQVVAEETEVAATHQCRRSDKSVEEEPSQPQPHGRGCSCCDCKLKFAVVEQNEPPLIEEEMDIEQETKQNCCCFTRKRSQRNSGDGGGSSCCKGKKDSSVQKSNRSSECKESTVRPEHAERVARNEKAHNRENDCHKEYSCKKKKGVPLTKCCKCTEDEYGTAYASSQQRYREEDRRRRKLAKELADRLQRRAELQIGLQKRLQDQLKAKQKQRCCFDPPPCCFAPYPCCEPRSEPVAMSCCEPQACCFQPPPCCYPPQSCCYPQSSPPCCYEPPPCYGQECPCCCQPMPYCYTAGCSYTKPGSCP